MIAWCNKTANFLCKTYFEKIFETTQSESRARVLPPVIVNDNRQNCFWTGFFSPKKWGFLAKNTEVVFGDVVLVVQCSMPTFVSSRMSKRHRPNGLSAPRTQGQGVKDGKAPTSEVGTLEVKPLQNVLKQTTTKMERLKRRTRKKGCLLIEDRSGVSGGTLRWGSVKHEIETRETGDGKHKRIIAMRPRLVRCMGGKL